MMKKKLIAMLLAVVLVLSFVVVPEPVSAANEYTVRLADAAGNSVITAKAGETVTLVLSTENNPGIISVGVKVTYPAGISISKRPKDVSTFGDVAEVVRTFSPKLTSNPYIMLWTMPYGDYDQKLIFEEGDLAEITFQIADDVEPGDYAIDLAGAPGENYTANAA